MANTAIKHGVPQHSGIFRDEMEQFAGSLFFFKLINAFIQSTIVF